MKSIELRKDRAKLIKDAGDIITKAGKESRAMTAEEEGSWQKMHDDADVLLKRAEQIEKQETKEAELAALRLEERTDDPEGEGDPDGDDIDEAKLEARQKKQSKLEMRAFMDWAKNGWAGLSPRNHEIARRHRPNDSAMKEIRGALSEKRAQTVTTTAGGYLIPRAFQKEIDQAMLAFSNMRGICRVLPTASGNPLDWPTVNDTAVKGRLLTINTGVTTTDIAFGTKAFGAYKFSSDIVLVPSELMQDADFGASFDSFLRDVLAERIARITNDYFTTGTGSAQPAGIVTGAFDSSKTLDISDFTTGDKANALRMIDIEHSLDPAYRPVASWMMHDTLLRDLKKTIDSNGRPIFRDASDAPGGIDKIMGYPFAINQSMADSGTATNKALLFGAMKKFIIREVRPMVLVRLNERYADADQVGFVAFSREDSGVIDAGTHPIKYAAMAA
jgi:HK97 family phage major capsid protein